MRRAQRSRIVVIENDFQMKSMKASCQKGTTFLWTGEEIIQIIREAGIIGMGGAGFPTATKIRSCLGKIDYLNINAAECEPYITADHRLILERPQEVISGLKILIKLFNLPKGYIGIEENKPDAIKILEQYAGEAGNIEVCVLKTKYPQGGEKQIIKAITGREVPFGKLPADLGAAVFNTETCASIYRAVATGMPSIQRIVTVAGGCVRHPGNFLTRVGTPFQKLFDAAGGFSKDPVKILSGGPMMGVAQFSTEPPVMKGTSALLALSETEVLIEEEPRCIMCGRCVEACPIHLMPNYLFMYANAGDLEYAEKIGILDCIECGACSFICPGRMHLTQMCRVSKQRILEAKRAKK